MNTISKKEFEELSAVSNDHCISMYIPTHKAGQEVIEEMDVTLLRNQLREVEGKLEELGLNNPEIEQKTAPIRNLIDDREFWRHQDEGLAVLLSDGNLRTFTLPVHFEAINQVTKGFYLKPLMPVFNFEGLFFILTLELKVVHFYHATPNSIDEVYPEDIPSRLEDTVGYDYEEKTLQYKTQIPGRSSFHGHGEGKDDRKEEILRFFRDINEGLLKEIHDKNVPLVIACLDYLFPIYKEANTYNFLMEEHISCNPKDLKENELHARALEKVEPLFTSEHEEKMAKFKQFHGTGRTSADIHEVLPAALYGKVDTLFLEKGSDIWGNYDPKTNEITLNNGDEFPHVSLSNLAAIKVFLQGGQVYLLDQNDMPDPQSKVNALYRY